MNEANRFTNLVVREVGRFSGLYIPIVGKTIKNVTCEYKQVSIQVVQAVNKVINVYQLINTLPMKMQEIITEQFFLRFRGKLF